MGYFNRYIFVELVVNCYYIVTILLNNFCSTTGKENIKKKKKRARKQLDTMQALSEMFICTKCTKSYRLRHSLTRHMKFECGKEPMYPCHKCPRRFKHKYDLNVHLRGRHKDDDSLLMALPIFKTVT